MLGKIVHWAPVPAVMLETVERRMDDDCYDLAVIGATCAGLGLALEVEGRVFLIEPGPAVAPDFVENMAPGIGSTDTEGLVLRSDAARRLHDELVARDCLAGGRLHLPALAPVLYERLARSGIAYRFLSPLLSCRVDTGGWTVEFCNRSGVQRIRARRLVDTSSACWTRRERHAGYRRRAIHAQLDRRDGSPAETASGDGWRIVPGRFAEEAVLVVELSADADWPQARERLHQVAARIHADTPYTVLSVAVELAGVPVQQAEQEGSWRYLPSAAHPHPLAAFDAGAVLAGELAATAVKGE